MSVLNAVRFKLICRVFSVVRRSETFKQDDSSTHITVEGKETKYYEYVPDGKWKVYYDTTKPILRAEGAYEKGEEDGKWLVYRLDGSLSKEYVFDNGIKKTEVAVDERGNRTTLVSLSDTRMFYEHNMNWLLGVMLVFVVGIRSAWNLITFDKIRGIKHDSPSSYWKEGGWNDGMLAPFIFWWLSDAKDSRIVARYKRTGNILNVLGISMFVAFFALASS